MLISLFLAKFLGLYLLVMGIMLLYRQKHWDTVARDFFDSPALILLSGAFALIFGLAIVLLHNVWEPGWRTVITVIGWFALVQAFIRLFMPEAVRKIAMKMTSPHAYLVVSAVMLLLGLFLTYHGFMG